MALEPLTHFHEKFLPFFEKFDHVLFETRTKSSNIEVFKTLKNLTGKKYLNTEIAFSLNPQEIIATYEKKTSSLTQRIEAINQLLQLGYRVGLRFLPLLPVHHFQTLYEQFLQDLQQKVDFSQISSIFIAPILYNEDDYQKIMKIYNFPFLKELSHQEHGLRKMAPDFYSFFDELFHKYFPEKRILRDYQ